MNSEMSINKAIKLLNINSMTAATNDVIQARQVITVNCYHSGNVASYSFLCYLGGNMYTLTDLDITGWNISEFLEFMHRRFHKFEDLHYCAPFDFTSLGSLLFDMDFESMIDLADRLGSVDVYFSYL